MKHSTTEEIFVLHNYKYDEMLVPTTSIIPFC